MRKPGVYIHGMLGIGDNIFQRAFLRELMQTHDVTLRTFYTSMYHDLVSDGLKLELVGVQVGRIRDTANRASRGAGPHAGAARQVTYSRDTIRQRGSILAAQYACLGLTMPEKPDFSLPVPEDWKRRAYDRIKQWDTGGRPICVYRPIVLNNAWHAPARAPDPEAYAELYQEIRASFFTVSVADLTTASEYIVRPEQLADVKLHRGELDFETLAGLFHVADLVFCCPGFAPVLAQAVGTPTIIVYGGNESFRTTNSVGAHLAPTLAIEPEKPCECHNPRHHCDKTINMPRALERVKEWLAMPKKTLGLRPLKETDFSGDYLLPRNLRPDPRVLIFATTYLDTPERVSLLDQWLTLHRCLNPTCDFLIVDTWPKADRGSVSNFIGDKHGGTKGRRPTFYHDFPDNLGHLARGGQDGWGRAFSRGLQAALDQKYDFVVHIEGDSLFRHPVMPIVRDMREAGQTVASVPVAGTRNRERNWIETGLMFFDTAYLQRTKFVDRYDWQNRKSHPTPEAVIWALVHAELTLLQFKAERGDRGQITRMNVRDYDWITHVPAEVSTAFAAFYVPGEVTAPPMKLNFGCGTNRIKGWQNYDSEVDISRPLPFPDASADFILAEHVVEHVPYYTALGFFRECRRVLKPGGVARICVPSIERIWKHGTEDYFKFAKRWAPTPDARGAIHAMLHEHGHKAAWTQTLLEASLFAAGFENIAPSHPGQSEHDDLFDVDGHHLVIGEQNIWIETAVAEAS